MANSDSDPASAGDKTAAVEAPHSPSASPPPPTIAPAQAPAQAPVQVGPLVTLPTGHWRVKVYRLDNGQWEDQGTGQCYGHIDGSHAYLAVKNELDPHALLLNNLVEPSTSYQKQDTLILWKDDQGDLALSFQEVTGCIVLCEFLVYVQREVEKDIQVLAISRNQLPSGVDVTESIPDATSLPPLPTLDNLGDVNDKIAHAAESQYGHDALVVYFNHVGYLRYLVDLFDKIEKDPALDHRQRLADLHKLAQIVKQLFLLGEQSMVEMLLEDEYFRGVLGALEYDEEFGERKANYREFFETKAKFRQVVPIPDTQIVDKIQRTFRLQLLKDVVLARLLDDATFNIVSSLIYMNQMDIIVWMQSSSEFSTALFGMYDPAKGSEETAVKDDGLQFTTHLTATSKSFQISQRVTLYLVMVENGLFNVLSYGLAHSSAAMRNSALEIVATILEADPTVIRVDGASRYNAGVINALVDVLNGDDDMSLRLQACEALKALLEPPAMHDAELEFYEASAPRLFGGLITTNLSRAKDQAQYFELVLDLLGFCYKRHGEECTTMATSLDIWSTIAKVIEHPPSKPALLAAVRCVRHMLAAGGVEEARQLVHSDCLGHVLAMLVAIGNVNNALHSAGLELLALITSNPDEKYCYLRHWLLTENLDAVGKLGYIKFLATLSEDETSDDEGRPRKRHLEDEHPQTPKRHRDSGLHEPAGSPSNGHVSNGHGASSPNGHNSSATGANGANGAIGSEGMSPERMLSPDIEGRRPQTESGSVDEHDPPATPTRPSTRSMSTPPASRQPAAHELRHKVGLWADEPAPGPGTPRPRPEKHRFRKTLVTAKKLMTLKRKG